MNLGCFSNKNYNFILYKTMIEHKYILVYNNTDVMFSVDFYIWVRKSKWYNL